MAEIIEIAPPKEFKIRAAGGCWLLTDNHGRTILAPESGERLAEYLKKHRIGRRVINLDCLRYDLQQVAIDYK